MRASSAPNSRGGHKWADVPRHRVICCAHPYSGILVELGHSLSCAPSGFPLHWFVSSEPTPRVKFGRV
eukprot:1168287-Rhodomonas_salina.1